MHNVNKCWNTQKTLENAKELIIELKKTENSKFAVCLLTAVHIQPTVTLINSFAMLWPIAHLAHFGNDCCLSHIPNMNYSLKSTANKFIVEKDINISFKFKTCLWF